MKPELEALVREALALEGYRSGTLTRGQVAESLGMTFYEAEEGLSARGFAAITV